MGRKRNRDPRSRSAERKRRRRTEKNNTSEADSPAFPNIILPEDIVVEILSRLSLDSLTRFTCVSKQWCSLISNICATKTRSPTVLLISKSRAYSFSPHSVDRNHQKKVHAKRVYVPWKNIALYSEKFRIMGSCNGLLLMHINEDVFLWNPLTGFFKKMLAYEELRDRGYGVCSGLCYDSTSNEYKAVLALAHETPDYGGEFVVVGNFRSKSWTVIDFPYMLPSENMGPIVNGNLHWFASKKHSRSRFLSPHQIIFFNAQMDRFEEVPMPKPTGEDGDILCGLAVLDGYLCMSRSDCPGDCESNVEVLIMKEYGIKSSWTILFLVSDDRFAFQIHDPLVPLGYTKNGRVLIKVCDYRRWHIRAFDLTDNSHRRISLPEHDYLHVIVHEESLITPTDYNWEEEDLKGVATYVQDSSHSRKMIMIKGSRGGYWTSLDHWMSSECESDSE